MNIYLFVNQIQGLDRFIDNHVLYIDDSKYFFVFSVKFYSYFESREHLFVCVLSQSEILKT